MSCLFNSLSYFHPKENEVIHDSFKIRQTICDFLLRENDNKDYWPDICPRQIAEFEGCSLENYVSRMRSPSTWGGALEIIGFINIYKMNVIVVNIRDTNAKDIEFILPTNTQTVKITWSGGHYEPLRE